MPETTRQPSGNYPHPAALHHLKLDEAAERLVDGLADHRRRSESLAREAGVSIVMMAMQAGETMSEHAADGVVTVQVLSGRASLMTGGASVTLVPGELIVFQPGVRHDLNAEQQSVILLTVTGGEP